jgi:hypothetical protein
MQPEEIAAEAEVEEAVRREEGSMATPKLAQQLSRGTQAVT